MVTPAVKHTIVKKRTAHFKRHQSNRFMRVGVCITLFDMKFWPEWPLESVELTS
jgi:hypothetical protein